MIFYFGKTYESSLAGDRYVGVECDKCGCQYCYDLARVGSGASTAPYYVATGLASKRANSRSKGDLEQRLADEAELVPCPECNWISEDLIQGYRRGRYRRLGKLALAVGFAGSILSLVFGWFILIGQPTDRWLLPHFLYGGPAVFAVMTAGAFGLRRWLRSRIQPNHDFPREPVLPLGTPPALIPRPAGNHLRQAKPTAPAGDGLVDFQLGRLTLPDVCCDCLQPAAVGEGHAIQVTRLLHFTIPQCSACGADGRRVRRRVSRSVYALGLVVSGGILVALLYIEAALVTILLSLLFLVAVFAVLAVVISSARTRTAWVVAADRSRGVVRLRFCNHTYAEVVTRHLNDTAGVGTG